MHHENEWAGCEEGGWPYVIHRPDTPAPWFNFLFSRDGELYARIDQRARGPMEYHHNVNTVSKGRNYCIVDGDEKACWSLNAGAAEEEAASYRCAHFPGRTVFRTEHRGLQGELTVALAPDTYHEINRVTLLNTTDRVRRLSLIGYHQIELDTSLFNNDGVEETRFDESCGALLCSRRHYLMPRFKFAAFYAADRIPDSYCGDWSSFVQADLPMHRLPLWRTGVLPGTMAYATRPIMALQHNVILQPGERFTIHYGLGLADTFEEASGLARTFLDEQYAPSALAANRTVFEEELTRPFIHTPDGILNTMLNTWTRLQLLLQVKGRRFGHTHNWRNNLQDAQGWMLFDPTHARKTLSEACSVAWEDGFMPRISPKIEGASALTAHLRHADIVTWALLLAGRYVAETGDLDLFGETVTYAGGAKTTTVADGLIRAADYLLDHRGEHGMVLLLEGDWSDPLETAGRRGKGESPWTSVALVNGLKHFTPVLEMLGRSDTAQAYREAVHTLTEAVNKHAWDGAWYIRGITDDGIRFCTHDDPDAKVSLMMQCWAILSGVIPGQRLESVVRAVDENNKYESGPILYAPPFMDVREELGRETVKCPGTGENGSTYTHAAMMWAAAEIKLGRADEALRIMRRVAPLRDPDASALTRQIPLWWPNYWHGPHSPLEGRSSHRITSGAPAWFFLNVCEGLLGVRPTLDGLAVQPCFPSAWQTARFTRRWRGSLFEFIFERKADIRHGVQVELDGHVQPDAILPPPADKGGKYEVRVLLPA